MEIEAAYGIYARRYDAALCSSNLWRHIAAPGHEHIALDIEKL
jgi:hypothetical protein